MIKGARVDEVNKNFDHLKSMIDNARAQHQQHPGGAPDQRPVANPGEYPGVDLVKTSTPVIDALMSVSHSQSHRKFDPVPLCTPGYDCDMNEFEDRAVRFLFSSKVIRKRSW
jgi:hypothetical protein